MNEKTIRIMCLALAEYARVEAMKAANAARQINGEALAYHSEEFYYSANALDQLAVDVISQ